MDKPDFSIEEQAVEALGLLPEEEKLKVLEYINNLIKLEQSQDDE
jgi:hypothetical protein